MPGFTWTARPGDERRHPGLEAGLHRVHATVFPEPVAGVDGITDATLVSVDGTLPLDSCPGPTLEADGSRSVARYSVSG